MSLNKIKTILMLLLISYTTDIYIGAHPGNGQIEHSKTASNTKRYIVQLNDHADKDKIRLEGIGGREVHIIREMDSINALLIEFTDGFEVDADFDDENVLHIEEDKIIRWIDPIIKSDDLEVDGANKKINIPLGVKRIGADEAKLAKKIDATIAIIDTGVDSKNKSLNVVKAVSFVEGEEAADLNGHGTHVAGTAAALNNGSGVVGVAPGAKIISLKVLNEYGGGSNADIIAAIDWVTKNADKIDVVNMSLGGMRGYDTDLIHEAIKKSVEKGVVYVVAAGNSASNVYEYEDCPYNHVPAAYPEVMTVSAMVDSDGTAGGYGPGTNAGEDDRLANFSNYSDRSPPNNPVKSSGASIDVAAPGVDILSTMPGNKFQKMSGTSMASPHVAGVVARYIAKNRKKLFSKGKNQETVYSIRQKLIDHAQPQVEWNAEGDAYDPDSNHEGLIQILE